MDPITAVYQEAVEHTKMKVFEDIDRYLGERETLTEYSDYINNRIHYLEQIWINVWLNKVTNKVSRNEKKFYLMKRGFDVEGVDRKLVNSLFRNELREYSPFDVISWLNTSFLNQDERWNERYEHARTNYLLKLQEDLLEETKEQIKVQIRNQSQEIIKRKLLDFYVLIRHEISKLLAKDIRENKRFILTNSYRLEDQLKSKGKFNNEDYKFVDDFLEELTGNMEQTVYWGKGNYEFETYDYIYEQYINDFIFDQIYGLILKEIEETTKREYTEIFDESLTNRNFKKMIATNLSELASIYFPMIRQEKLTDLLEVSKVPFNLTQHLSIYQQDLEQREKERAEELAEIQRKKEEETKILEDIFRHEYSPSYRQGIKYVLHIGDTNTGKTHHALQKMKEAESGLYLAPLRLLALEVYDKLNAEGVLCSLKTGEEEKEVKGATHISATVEMFHEKEFYEVIVIDEAQMIADKDRGFSWYKAITKANANEVHIIGSKNIKMMMRDLLEDSSIEVNEYKREIPLQVEPNPFQIKHTKKGDALVCFSRRRVLETASKLQNEGYTVSLIYGSMPPETRKKQMQQFIDGETKVIVSTDAIGMGLNLPIQRIVFLENDKFDGTRRRRLTSQEVKQIAGRAGRKGIYNIGMVAFTSDIKIMKRLLQDKDEPVQTFAIAPTNTVFERFQKYSRDLQTFFEIWEKFESPKGTKKSSLLEERSLYETIRDTEIEARLPMMDLYGFLHLPFSSNEPRLVKQWQNTMLAIVQGKELPEPIIGEKDTLEELELSYKAIGLHLLFLYRLGQRTEATYWERIREGISDEIHEFLKSSVKSYTKKCKNCGKPLPWDYSYGICGDCYYRRSKKINQRKFG